MTENDPSPDDARVEALQAAYDRVNSWQESATPEKIREELDRAVAEAGIEISPETRDRLVRHIDGDGGREDVATLL